MWTWMVMLRFLKTVFLEAADRINVVGSPFEEFKRPPSIIDLMPLAHKDKKYWEDLNQNFRIGPEREFLAYEKPCTLGDQALWQGCAAATAAFRGDPRALAWMMAGIEKLVYLGGNARIARGAASKSKKDFQFDANARYFYEGDYVWLDNCSESSILGILLGCWAQIHLGTKHEALAKKILVDLAEQVWEDGFRLIGQDGARARFGDLRPIQANMTPIRIASGALLMLLAGHAGGNDRFLAKYAEICSEHMGSLTHLETHFLWRDPAYDDLLAVLVFTMLITTDQHPYRKLRFREAFKKFWARVREQGNSLYTYLYFLAMGPMIPDSKYLRLARQTLAEFNANPEAGPLTKGPPRQNDMNPPGIRFRQWGKWSRPKRISTQPIPPWMHEPVDFYWQRSPYEINAHSEKEMCGLDFCMAFSIGKHEGAI